MSEKIKKEYYEKIKLFLKYNESYFDKNKPIVPDSDYDELKKQIIVLEKNYKFLKSENSPSNTIGYKPSKNFKKVKHKVPMLSLSNAFDEEDLINFEKKILNYLDLNKNFEIEYSAEPKIDGISASVTYIKSKLFLGLSRGDGNEGEDITNNLMTIQDIPKKITSSDFPEEIDIKASL